jgi:hypothetical protein
MKRTIIAFCGVAGSGKDTACNYLCERGYEKTSFAAPLKAMAKLAFGFSDEQLYGPSSMREVQDPRYPLSGICLSCGDECTDADERGPEENDLPEGYRWYCGYCDRAYPRYVNARVALQTLGTEWGRRLHADVWAKAAVNFIQSAPSYKRYWCLSDLRFRNELQAVKAAGGYVVRLMRGTAKSNHPSEAELLEMPMSEFDFVIHNHGDLPELYSELDRIMQQVN